MAAMSMEKILHEIDAEIARLNNVRSLLATLKPGKNGKVIPHHSLSEAARKRISRAQRKRWREQKRAARAAK